VTTHLVTGAFGYSGRRIAARLLGAGEEVRTLTNAPGSSDPFDGRVPASPLCFDKPSKLAETLSGVDVLYNTYWVRFNHSGFSHTQAVENTLTLFAAARRAGVRRIVHVSITNPSLDSPLEYFRGKAELERALKETGLSLAILRPAVLFGEGDILINNIAWALRRLPVFGVFGDGRYRLQPVHVDDLAELAILLGQQDHDVVMDAIGPETFSFRELVTSLGEIIRRQRPVVSVPPWLGYLVARVLGGLLGDVLLTRQEIQGLMEGLLCTSSEPTGRTRLTQWARQHASTLGLTYANELARRRDRRMVYDER